jgi:hypothetical protein
MIDGRSLETFVLSVLFVVEWQLWVQNLRESAKSAVKEGCQLTVFSSASASISVYQRLKSSCQLPVAGSRERSVGCQSSVDELAAGVHEVDCLLEGLLDRLAVDFDHGFESLC